MMLRAKFQLLNRVLTILLHLCCSSAPPRFAHETISMCSAQSCDFWAENCSCSGQDLYKSRPFCTSNLVHSIPMQRNPTIPTSSKFFRYCCICTKVLLSLFAACPHFVQMLAITLSAMHSSRTQPEYLMIFSVKVLGARNAHSGCMFVLTYAAWPLLAFVS